MLALAVDLVWGYCGILSLGHAAFFALGGYAMGMYLMRQIGTRGVYGDPVLPDFMVFLNWKELPWFWQGFDMFWFAVLMVVVVPGLLALRVRLVRLPLARHGRVSLDHHAGADLCADARVLPQRHGLRRQQRLHRFQGSARLRTATPGRAGQPVPAARAFALAAGYIAVPLHRDVARGSRGRGDPRCGEPHALHRLPRRVLQALGVRVLGGARRHRRRAVRAAGRHHQSRASSRRSTRSRW